MSDDRPTPTPPAINVAGPGRRPGSPAPSDTAPHAAPDDEPDVATVYRAVGGQPFFDALVERFYEHVEADPVLLSLYPEPDDLGPARQRLALFLAQFWGGPTTYSDTRGHPRLRMRHAPFVVDDVAAQHWLDAMLDALDRTMPDAPLDDEQRAVTTEQMQSYFRNAARHLINTD
ncbi:MAG: globin [Microthrixaceae bacterium]